MAIERIDYSRTVGQANEIQELSDELDQEIEKLQRLWENVKRDWQGPASQAYQNQLLILIAEMKTTRFNMSSLSTSIKNAARRIRDEDQERAEQEAARNKKG